MKPGLWWKRGQKDQSYLYRGNELLGVVRFWGDSPLAKPGEEWSAYSNPSHQTYHPTKRIAMKELKSRFMGHAGYRAEPT